MNITSHTDPLTTRQTYTLTIDSVDLVRAKLTVSDRQLLAECNGRDAAIADRLLALELLARRIENP